MPQQFKGVVNVDITDSVPDWEPYTQAALVEIAIDRLEDRDAAGGLLNR